MGLCTTNGKTGGMPNQNSPSTWWDGRQVAPTLDVAQLVKGQMMPLKQRFPVVLTDGKLRRVTPLECERLMGWPDAHTAMGRDDDGVAFALSDTARYRLCGNGVGSPVTAWIGARLRQAGA